jgi:hypothetical protein
LEITDLGHRIKENNARLPFPFQVAKDPDCIYFGRNCLLNFEKKPLLTIIVKAFDDGAPSRFLISDVPIPLLDMDDKPVNITLEKSEIPESIKIGE